MKTITQTCQKIGPWGEVKYHARLSKNGRHRYSLTRTWASANKGAKKLVFIMINPSTADGLTDDNTIRRCMNFARTLGYKGIAVLNLYSFRTKDVEILRKAKTPTNLRNDQQLQLVSQLREIYDVCFAWGNKPFASKRIAEVEKLFPNAFCLRKTKDGYPEHPLFLPGNLKLIPYK